MACDGHKHIEDVRSVAMSLDRMETVQGCLGVVEPWKGSKAKLDSTTKSERTVACIDKAIDDFHLSLLILASHGRTGSRWTRAVLMASVPHLTPLWQIDALKRR